MIEDRPAIGQTTTDMEQAALPPVRSEPLLAWIVSRLTTAEGRPMGVGRDTSAEIVERIQRHANKVLSGFRPSPPAEG